MINFRSLHKTTLKKKSHTRLLSRSSPDLLHLHVQTSVTIVRCTLNYGKLYDKPLRKLSHIKLSIATKTKVCVFCWGYFLTFHDKNDVCGNSRVVRLGFRVSLLDGYRSVIKISNEDTLRGQSFNVCCLPLTRILISLMITAPLPSHSQTHPPIPQ